MGLDTEMLSWTKSTSMPSILQPALAVGLAEKASDYRGSALASGSRRPQEEFGDIHGILARELSDSELLSIP